MKKLLALLLAAAWMLALCACGNGLCFDEKPTIRFARDHVELLERCVEEISSKFCPDDWNSWLFFPENGRLYMCENTTHREDSKTEIDSPAMMELFHTQKVKTIFVRAPEHTLKSIEFLVDSIGMGSSSHADILFIPSERIEDSFFYWDNMSFHAFREGYIGEIQGSDDYLYYVHISPCWFYIEYGD